VKEFFRGKFVSLTIISFYSIWQKNKRTNFSFLYFQFILLAMHGSHFKKKKVSERKGKSYLFHDICMVFFIYLLAEWDSVSILCYILAANLVLKL